MGIPARLIGLLAQVVTLVLIAHNLPTANYGILAVATSIVVILGMASGHFAQQAARVGDEGTAINTLLRPAVWTSGLLTTSGIVLVAVLPPRGLSSVLAAYLPLLALAPFVALMSGAGVIAGATPLAVSQSGDSAFRLLLLIPITALFSLTPVTVALIDSVASAALLLTMGLMIRTVLGRVGSRPGSADPKRMNHPGNLRRVARSGLVLGLSSAAGLALQRLDVLMQGALAGGC